MTPKIPFTSLLLLFLCSIIGSSGSHAQISNLLFNSTESITVMNFDTPTPTLSYTGVGATGFIGEAIAHAEDSNGNILFFIIANAVFRADGTQMPGSVGLLASPSSAEMNICLVPGETDKYYIIYQEFETCDQLYYSIVDMSLAGGLGDVDELNVQFEDVEHAEGMEIIRIPGTDEYWYLSYKCYTAVERYKIDASGFSDPVEILSVVPTGLGFYDGRMELDYHEGKIAFGFNGKNQAFIADFDPVTGNADNLITIDDVQAYGAEFSEDGSKVYFSSWAGDFAQYDILTSTVTDYSITNCGSAYGFGQIELGGDGNLYLINWNANCLTKIEDANTTTPNFITIDLDFFISLGISDHIQSDVLPSLEISAEIENVKCYQEYTGSIALTITGGEEPYNIQWNHDPFNSNTTLTDLPAGTYTVTVTDIYSTSLSQTYTISQPDLLLVDATITQPLCANDSGVIELEVTGGTTPYTYNWNGIDPNAVPEGEHTVIVSDANECVREIKYTIVNPSPLEPNIITKDALCHENFGSMSLEVSGGTPPYTIDLQGEDKDRILAGDYSYTITDDNGCSITGNYTIHQPEKLDINVIFAQLDCNEFSGYATTFIRGGVEPYDINWFGFNPEDLRPGDYTVEVVDANECVYQEKFSYQPIGVKVYAPTAFTPNNDGLNETFVPVINCYSSFEMNIYDRWGKKIFSSNDPNTQWDGTFEGENLKQGVYFYSLQVVDSHFNISDHNGHISLIR